MNLNNYFGDRKWPYRQEWVNGNIYIQKWRNLVTLVVMQTIILTPVTNYSNPMA